MQHKGLDSLCTSIAREADPKIIWVFEHYGKGWFSDKLRVVFGVNKRSDFCEQYAQGNTFRTSKIPILKGNNRQILLIVFYIISSKNFNTTKKSVKHGFIFIISENCFISFIVVF